VTAPLDRLLRILRTAGVDLTPVEVAEALWLALRVDLSGEEQADPSGPAPEPDGSAGQVELRLPVQPAVPAPDRSEPPEPPEHAQPSESGGQVTFETVPGRPMRVHTAGALPHSGRVMRALRPLKRQRLSSRRFVLDEDATARQIAERRLWTPVWRPAPDRWLHLTLVLDETSVGGVWRRLGQEIRIMLERLGAFRTMRVVRLGLGDDETLHLVRPDGTSRSPAGLADHPGENLILVLSDCVGPPWHDGAFSRLLRRWARRAPVAILQPLPERLWSRTGLAPVPGRLFAPRAGAPAAAYTFASALRRRRFPGDGIPVPVLEIEPRWLGAWARLVTGRAAGGIDAVVTAATATGRRSSPAPARTTEPSAEQRVRDFRAGASAPAYELARYLTVARPLNLAVMRLLQTVMVAGSRPSHLAEVLYGNLLRPLSPSAADTDEQHFEFLPGVRHALRATLADSDPERVFTAVSGYLDRHPDRTGALFTALASLPLDARDVPGAAEPFAGIRAELLRRYLGGTGSALPVRRARDRVTVLHLNGPSAAAGHATGQVADLVVVTGGVAVRATPSEYRAAYRRLEDLRAGLGLPVGRIVVVPGLSDVNEGRCHAYFRDQEADGLEPVPPYWPKWEPFAALTAQLPGGTVFQEHQPWQLFEIPALRTVVAALNSTVPLSHLPGGERGGLGDAQVTWFGDRLRDYEDRGWLRIGVVHHDPVVAERLVPCLDVVLHGQNGGVRELGMTGVPAIGDPGRSQLVELRAGTLRVSSGDRVESHAYGDHWWLAAAGPPPAPRSSDDPGDVSRSDLLAVVARAYRARHPGVPLVERQWPGWDGGYLVADPSGGRRCIGVFDGTPDDGLVERFVTEVVRRERPGRAATLVCRVAAGPELARRARDRDVLVTDFADFQIGDDVLRFAADQAAASAPGSYVPPQVDGADLITMLRRWLTGPDGRVATVTGAWGTGKSSLLRELARQIHLGHDPVVPVLLHLPDHDWRAPLDELIAVQLVRGGVREVDREHIRYLLGEGRFVVLCDGLDDLGDRAGRAALHRRLRSWQAMVRDRFAPVKLVLAGRGTGPIGEAVAPYPADQVLPVRLDGFGPAQILDFLTRRLGPERAHTRVALLGRVDGLLTVAGNPRMLALIAAIDEEHLPSSAIGLYPVLIDAWLVGELRTAVTALARRLWESGTAPLPAGAVDAGPLLVRDRRHWIHFADRSLLEWLVAGEIAVRLEPGPPSGDLRALLRRPMSPLMAGFVGELAGTARARAWAGTAPDGLGDAARRILDQLG
jgi:3',5'-cyclic AMP phosphodiesterase CpdA